MNTFSSYGSTFSLGLQQFKSQALLSLTATTADAGSRDLFATLPSSSGLFDQLLADARLAPPTSAIPSGLDALQGFSQPGQNVATVINRVEISYQAQYAALNDLKTTLTQEQQAARQLGGIDAATSSADIKSLLTNFISTYNDGVNRLAGQTAAGGVLEGSQEAQRARFATLRDINNPLIGADGGLRGGMRALGISVDAKTGLATIDHARLDAVLAQDTDDDMRTLVDFANNFMQTTASLTAQDNQQDRQMNNLARAIHWIADNRVAVEQEFGFGEQARPNSAFAKAAAAYALIAKQ